MNRFPIPGLTRRSDLVTLREEDLAEVAGFVAIQSRRQPADVERHLRWFLLENPAWRADAPLGYGLRIANGDLVGCILVVPQVFRYQQQTFLLMGSSSFYVDQRHRGSGGLIFLKFSQLGREFTVFGNSANADAAQLWRACGATHIPFTDQELLGAINWGPILEEMLARKAGPNVAWRLAGRLAAPLVATSVRLELECDESVSLSRLASAEDVTSLPIHAAPAEFTASRDLPYIHWRYFCGRDATIGAFAFQSKRLQGPVLVTVNQRPRGYRQQIRTLNVLDIYPAVPPEVCSSIVAALIEQYRTSVDAIVLRGQDERRQQLFCRAGFKRRQFDSPNGWLLDRRACLPTRNWYFVPADGDWLI